ncbi:hypothetical protein Rhe02_96400 [Rhizocola hellebori]|uniref:FAD-dependent urate hydroxylase HpyO/Asp monooxygenase CreE-like FAD/NAD(P)-binding domain-containing protein n=1 Tax=Rhizocola hellebori TaxID=1392758 RepID=A0A8J3QLE5_9ACTN|nr:FAD-dependent oxidoreductase [Rhizocola hellebori]GIH11573.1 hypothetical protein Rhe02_96400 [Rhizocola hellebori]
MAQAVVIGAGFSGVLAARELLRTGWSVVLVDPGARPGRGLAYGTNVPWHLLNSPVSAMSIDPDDPDHFLRWCRHRDGSVVGSDFVARGWYGDYLTEALRDADRIAPGELVVHRGRVVRIFEGSSQTLAVLLADDVVVNADRVVLAVGNARPDERFPISEAARASAAYVRDPWAPGALDELPEGPALLVGTGLTAVDVALTLSRTGRHRRITAVSRHGLLPQRHAPAQKITLEAPAGASLAVLLRAIRAKVSEVGDWRAVMDALRPHWNELWRELPEADQRRFLRHLARHWEVHRHRMAPPIAAAIDTLRAEGVLEIGAAEICGIAAESGGGLRATLHTAQTAHYAAVVNCTGPGRLVEADPLVRSLIADGLAQRGPHGLGLAVDEHGALIGRSPRPPAIYTLGAPRRGHLWETTAAPEIRAQARALADHLTARRSVAGGFGALGSCRADTAYPLPG